MLRTAAVAILLALALLPSLAAQDAQASQTYPDPDEDADGVLDVAAVTVTFGNGTARLQVRFVPGEVPDDRAVRGVVVLGGRGTPEPDEWYQVTIANETTVYVAHGDGPRVAELVATSWTGDIASAEWRREAPAAAPECTFAVVEAGTLAATGFTRSDVAPPGFESPEEAWPVEACPTPEAEGAGEDGDGEEKGTPGLGLPLMFAAVLLAAILRRRP